MYVLHMLLLMMRIIFFNDTATPEIYTYLHTLSLLDALPISCGHRSCAVSRFPRPPTPPPARCAQPPSRSSTATSSGASGALSTYGTRPSSSANSIDAACRNRRLSPTCSRRRLLTSGSPYLSSPATEIGRAHV